ncbi:MAG: tetratricopeptide repeat protein [Bryobacteraceae bacterium]
MRGWRSLLLVCLPAWAAIPPLPEGLRAVYNLEYDRAITLLEQETRERPDDPEVWNHLAQALLHRALFAAGALDSSSFTAGNSFLRRPKVPMGAEEMKRFDNAIARSLALCTERLRTNPADAACLYASGVAHGHRAQMLMWVKKAWWDALREGTRSREAHEKLLKLDPSLADARLIPGLHEYIAGSLPWYIRAFAFLAGFRGDRRRGIEQMEEAVREGRKTAVEARVLLAVVLRREGEPAKAAPLMGELAEAFPGNYLYRIEEIRLLAEAGRAPEARSRLDSLARSGLLPAAKIEELRASTERILMQPRSRSQP